MRASNPVFLLFPKREGNLLWLIDGQRCKQMLELLLNIMVLLLSMDQFLPLLYFLKHKPV